MRPVPVIDFGAHLTRLDSVSPVEVKGRVKEARVVVPVLVAALRDGDTFIRRDAARAAHPSARR